MSPSRARDRQLFSLQAGVLSCHAPGIVEGLFHELGILGGKVPALLASITSLEFVIAPAAFVH